MPSPSSPTRRPAITRRASAAGQCVDNPCDPGCVDFVDTPEGLADAGTNIDATDAGIIPIGEGGSVCVPKTCADQGKDCGPVSDGCGGLLQCGTCSSPKICGLDLPSVCSVPTSCTNLCLKQVSCPTGGATSVTGKVYAPNGVEPLPNAIVYVPNAPVTAFSTAVSCDNCLMASGSPLVSTTTGADGTFKLTNMPVGTNIPLVIQIGRWRRQVTIPTVTACASTAVAASLTRLPKSKAEGDIPKMAFVHGQGRLRWSACGARSGSPTPRSRTPIKMAGSTLYAGGHQPGAYINNIGGNNGTPWESQLLGSAQTLAKYDMVLFPCQGAPYYYATATHKAYQTNLANYANAGGRIFATHYSYIWLYSDNVHYFSPLAPAVTWSLNQSSPTPDPQTGYIDTTFAKGALLSEWLKTVGASATAGKIRINTLRRDFTGVNAPTQQWMYLAGNPTIPQHVTFNTPLGASAQSQCGRVVFSDFHVEDSTDANKKFPTECGASSMTPQEKLLEFMLFDLASCVQPDQIPPACAPITCGAQGLDCGPAGDGCGGTLNCGTCTAPKSCGGGGTQGVCGSPFNYYDGYFVRDYDATLCPHGTTPSWRLWSWGAITPSDSRIEFNVQTATTKAGLATAPIPTLLLFSHPPGPAALERHRRDRARGRRPRSAAPTRSSAPRSSTARSRRRAALGPAVTSA